jgi:hypothetical protein
MAPNNTKMIGPNFAKRRGKLMLANSAWQNR